MSILSDLVVSTPPLASELTAEFGTPTEVGVGFTVVIDDGGGGTAVYTCISDGTNWWTVANIKAV